MSKKPQKTRTITFGKIMLTLLVLGVFVVIGLLFRLYETIRQTPAQTAAHYQPVSTPVPQVQILSPDYQDNKTAAQGKSEAIAASDVVTQSAASTPEKDDQLLNANMSQTDDSIKKLEAKKKKERLVKTDKTKEMDDSSIKGEIPLAPTNSTPTPPKHVDTPKMVDTPKGKAQELKPSNAQPVEAREPAKSKSAAPSTRSQQQDSLTNELF